MAASKSDLRYWLFKSEPSTYSLNDLKKDKKTAWNGIRNFQARGFLKDVQVGDLAVIYHSGDDKSAVGLARVIRAAYPDPDPKKPGDWLQVDIRFEKAFPNPVPLSRIRETKELKDLLLIRQSRLSVMPIKGGEFNILARLGGLSS